MFKTRHLVLCFLLLGCFPSTFLFGADEPLKQDLDQVLRAKKVRESGTSIHIISRDSGKTVYGKNPDLALNPASTLKILTSAAALDLLGPDHRFYTEIKTSGKDVCIVGGGDPMMVHERLWLLVEEARRRGLKKIEGTLILDDSLFPTSKDHADQFRGDRRRAFTAPISALSLNFNSITIHGYPTSVGKAAEVGVEPSSRYFDVRNRSKTVRHSNRKDLKASLNKSSGGYTLHVSGRVGMNHDRASVYRSFPAPWKYFAYVFLDYFTLQGGAWSGNMSHQACPKGAQTFMRFESTPLARAIRGMGKFSNNFIAEMLLRALASDHTDKSGLTRLKKWLEEKSPLPDSFEIKNASGLSRGTRISAKLLTDVLHDSFKNPRIWPDLYASLSSSGEDGTLKRMDMGLEKGMIRAKTGRLAGVSAIAGLGRSERHGDLIFAVLLNDVPDSTWKLMKAQEELLKTVFSR